MTSNQRSLLRKAGRLAAFSLVAAMTLSGALLAGEINEVGGVAIKGYDPVAYFTDGKAVNGKPEFASTYKGATFRFASAAHKKAFDAAPDRYAPQYGGFCAYGTADGHKADIDPAAFTVVSGKLYLNYSKAVQTRWKQDVPGYIAKANDRWGEVSQQSEVIR